MKEFNPKKWLIDLKEIKKAMRKYKKEFSKSITDAEKVEHFLELNHHLVRGDPKKHHIDFILGLAGVKQKPGKKGRTKKPEAKKKTVDKTYLVCPVCNNIGRKGRPYSDTVQGRRAFEEHVAFCKPTTPMGGTLGAVTESSLGRIFEEVGEPASLVYMAELLHVSQDPFAPKVICPVVRRLRYCHMCQSHKTTDCMEPEKALAVDEETRTKAEEFLIDPAMLHRIKVDMDGYYVGMAEIKLLSFLLSCTCATERDYTNQTIQGESAAGKSALVSITLDYLPPEWYEKVGRLTPTALDYLTDQDFKLLWIQEMRGAEGAAPSIRLSSSSDGGTKIMVTERGADGRFTTGEYKVPGRSFITTTTEVEIHAEDATRSWQLSIDESPQQTALIQTYIAQCAETQALIEALGIDVQGIRPIVQEALRRIDFSAPVIIPYASTLIEVMSSKIVRTRRDFQKILGLIRVIALLHQRMRPMIEVNDVNIVVATPNDAVTAFTVAGEPLEETLTGLNKRLIKAHEAAITLHNNGVDITRSALAGELDIGYNTIKRYLQGLTNAGVMDIDMTKKPYIYNLRKRSKMEGSDSIKEWTGLMPKMVTQFNELRSIILANNEMAINGDPDFKKESFGTLFDICRRATHGKWIERECSSVYIAPLSGTKTDNYLHSVTETESLSLTLPGGVATQNKPLIDSIDDKSKDHEDIDKILEDKDIRANTHSKNGEMDTPDSLLDVFIESERDSVDVRPGGYNDQKPESERPIVPEDIIDHNIRKVLDKDLKDRDVHIDEISRWVPRDVEPRLLMFLEKSKQYVKTGREGYWRRAGK